MSLDLADWWNRNNNKKDTSSRGDTTIFAKSVFTITLGKKGCYTHGWCVYTSSTRMSVSFALTTAWVSGFSLSILFTWNITRVSASSCLHCNCCIGSRTTDPFTVYLWHWSSNANYRECPDKIWVYSGRSHSQKINLSNADLNYGSSKARWYSVGRFCWGPFLLYPASQAPRLSRSISFMVGDW